VEPGFLRVFFLFVCLFVFEELFSSLLFYKLQKPLIAHESHCDLIKRRTVTQ
jgi:hypothetical protein